MEITVGGAIRRSALPSADARLELFDAIHLMVVQDIGLGGVGALIQARDGPREVPVQAVAHQACQRVPVPAVPEAGVHGPEGMGDLARRPWGAWTPAQLEVEVAVR